jgi:outer membrane protein TolC
MKPPALRPASPSRPPLAAVLLILGLWLPGVQAQEVPLGATLDGLLQYAREHNPELRVERLEAAAAHERIVPAEALPDPMFQIELMDFTNTMSGRAASVLPGEVGTTRYRVTQGLPFWGKRALRGELATAEASREDTRWKSAAATLRGEIRSAYTRYYQAAGQARILTDTLALAGALERLALARYGVGLVPQQDAIQAQSEITALKVELVEAARARRKAAAQLNALLPRAVDAPLAEPAGLPPVPPELLAADSPLGAVLARALADSPDLARERAGVTVAERTRAVTYRERYPDFAVGLTNNRPRSGTDDWDLMLEVNIPLQQAPRRAREREAEHGLEAAHARVAAAEARLAGRIGETLAAVDANRDKARLLRHTLLPQAEATLAAAHAGYETGQVNFNTLIEAERQILRTRLALLDAEVETSLSATELEQLAGASL